MRYTVIGLAPFLIALPAIRAQAPLLEPLHRMLPTDNEESREIALGDFDGDGALAAIPIPPLGVLRLAPQLLWSPGSGSLAGSRGEITLQVPGDPTLSGVAIYWQALLAFPLKLTNLEVTTIAI